MQGLYPRFRKKIEELLLSLEEKSAFFVPYESRRSLERQAHLYAKGRLTTGKIVTYAQPGESSHNWGLGVDIVLDTNKIAVRKRDYKGKMYRDAWDTESPQAFYCWETLRETLRGFDDLEGGINWRVSVDKPFGFDPPHIQMAGWEYLRPDNWRQIVAEEIG